MGFELSVQLPQGEGVGLGLAHLGVLDVKESGEGDVALGDVRQALHGVLSFCLLVIGCYLSTLRRPESQEHRLGFKLFPLKELF